MSAAHARALVLKSYAVGAPSADNFELVSFPVGPLEPGDVLVRTLYLGMDAFPRLRIGGDAKRAPQIPIGEVMIGRGVGRVLLSNHPKFAEGDYVMGELGWRDHAAVKGDGLTPVDPALGPVRHALSVLGPAGVAAWCAVIAQGAVAEGERVLITGAAGGVGSIACQIAKLKGARVFGVLSAAQARLAAHDLGLESAIAYDAPTVESDLAAAAGDGFHLTLDLVGGKLFDAAIANAAPHGRVVLVGTVSDYTAGEVEQGPRPNYRIIIKRLRVSGFLVADHASRFGDAMADLSRWIAAGDLKVKEQITHGLEAAPEAFAALFGANSVGKQIVQVAEDK